MSNPTRKMNRRNRDAAIKKGTAYRRLIGFNGMAIHATKGRIHDGAVLDYRLKLIMERLGAGS